MAFIKKYKLEIILLFTSLAAHFFFFFLLLLNYGPDTFYITSEDAREFFQIAKNLYSHHVFSGAISPPFYLNSFRTILYPLYLAFFQIFSSGAWLPIIFQNIISSFSIVLVYHLGLMLTKNKKISFLASLLFALDPLQNYWSNIVEPDTIMVFFTLLALIYFFKFWLKTRLIDFSPESKIKYRYLCLAGIFLGLATLAKPIALYLPILLCCFLLISEISNKQWRKAIKPIFLFVLVFFLVIFPWLFRNWYQFKVFSISSIVGVNLYRYAGDAGPYTDEIKNYIKSLDYPAGLRDIRAQKVLKSLSLKLILDHPFNYSKAQLLGMVKFFIDDGHKEAYYLKHYKAMLFYNTPEPENKPNISEEFKKGNFAVLLDMIKSLNRYMVTYLLSKLVYLLGYIILVYGLVRSYRLNKNLFYAFVLLIAFAFYIALVAGPWGTSVRYRLPVLPGLLLVLSYGIFHLPIPKFCGKVISEISNNIRKN